ncbi:MAG: T9SS C-terminal target domain-containing protein [Deltaproteobacteria bacterium]|nr:T9SS C-terminal target domain-containing protein [Deltaproteobacteria bacterium]
MFLYHITFMLLILTLSGCRDKTLIASGHSSPVSDTDTGPIGPQIRVDLNISGRTDAEVNEPDYLSWPIEDAASLSREFDGITITFERSGENGTQLTSEWYKAGVQTPNLARLANDGMIVADGDAGAEITMTISGLPTGQHSLLTFHNTFINPDGVTFSPLNIYVNELLHSNRLSTSNRVLNNADAATAYLQFDATEGDDVTIRFQADTESDADIRNVVVCGFELNTPDLKARAVIPVPRNGDEHVDADSGSAALSWRGSEDAILHHVYIGTTYANVAEATTDSSVYHGVVTTPTFTAPDMYSMNTYYWRVDEEDSTGNVTPGTIWSFRPRQLAFPDAEGYGRFARGGRQGDIVYVSSLNDSGPGSLRDALMTEGPRTVLFSVSGVISLDSPLIVTSAKITIAGESAPGKGICISGAPFALSGAEDVIIRNLRVRAGGGDTQDTMGISGSDHIIVDRSSVSWSTNVGVTSRNARNVTVQRSLLSEALNVAGHEDYPDGTEHGFATSLGGDVASFHHNLLAHNQSRNFSLDGGLDGDGAFSGRIDIFNNVVYNWSTGLGDGGAHQVNFVNNFFQPGPASSVFTALAVQYESFPGTQQYYVSGNVMPGYFDDTTQDLARSYTGTPDGYTPWVDAPFFNSFAAIHSASDAYKIVLSDVGAAQPILDNHDIRVISETLSNTATYAGSITGLPGIPDHESDVGGLEDYGSEVYSPAWDSDKDGLPDFWEIHFNMNLNSDEGDFSDSNNDDDRNGWTALDDYLQWMNAPHVFTDENTPVAVDATSLFGGFTDAPVYTVTNISGGTAMVEETQITFTPASCGFAAFDATVTDADGTTLTRTINVYSCL